MKKNYLLQLSISFEKLARSSNEYMRNYMKDRYHNKRNSVISQLGGKCKSCGSKDKLHLDHIDKSKKSIRMSDIHSVNDQKVNEELKNVQLLCEECHKQKTKDAWDYGTNKPSHGTYWMYRKYKCRCDACSKAYKAKKKEWRTPKAQKDPE